MNMFRNERTGLVLLLSMTMLASGCALFLFDDDDREAVWGGGSWEAPDDNEPDDRPDGGGEPSVDPSPGDGGEPEPSPTDGGGGEPEPSPTDGGGGEPEPSPTDGGEPEPPPVDAGGEPEPPPVDAGGDPDPPPPVDGGMMPPTDGGMMPPDCGLTPEDLQTDNENCGVCGFACDGFQTCVTGMCLMATYGGKSFIDEDSGYLYVAGQGGTISRFDARATASAATVVTGAGSWDGLSAEQGRVAAINNGTLYDEVYLVMNADGNSPSQVIAEPQVTIVSVSGRENNVIALSANNAWWLGTSSVQASAFDGTLSMRHTVGVNADTIIADSTTVYYFSLDTDRVSTLSDASPNAAPAVLTSSNFDFSDVEGVAQDTTNLYYAGANSAGKSTIMRVAKDGGSSQQLTPLFGDDEMFTGEIVDVAVDDNALYFLVNDSNTVRVYMSPKLTPGMPVMLREYFASAGRGGIQIRAAGERVFVLSGTNGSADQRVLYLPKPPSMPPAP